jgi:very-short-patch-repair endonuclease
MTNSKTSYSNLSKTQKKDLLTDLYSNKKYSFADIANMYGTYANKIRRDAKSLNIPIRDKSEAQKNALDSGRHKHPTKGTSRPEETKNKIGQSIVSFWDNLSDDDLEKRRLKFKENWDKLTEEEKQNMQKAATDAVRKSSKEGSKLEKFLLNKLLQDGYKVEFHKEQSLVTTKLQIDLFLPSMNTAIEVDGPSHFLPVWGDDALQKNIEYDKKKQGLILGKGLALIRIKQTKDFSKTRSILLYDKLRELLKDIEANFPTPDKRNFSIED